MLIYVTNPIITIPNLIKEFKRFGEISNFKVNYDKSEMLNMSLLEKTYSLLQKDFPFKWKQKAIKYLGILIPKDLDLLQELNYDATIRKLSKLLQKYDIIAYSWMGRINIIKMDILPKLLYIFQTIPLDPPKKLLLDLRKAVVSLIWAHKTPRIKRDILIRKKKWRTGTTRFCKILTSSITD